LYLCTRPPALRAALLARPLPPPHAGNTELKDRGPSRHLGFVDDGVENDAYPTDLTPRDALWHLFRMGLSQPWRAVALAWRTLMNHVSDDTPIVQFYDELFEVASSIVKKGEEHAPMVLILNTAGALRGLLLVGLDPDQRQTS
jgi:hypothetical protein